MSQVRVLRVDFNETSHGRLEVVLDEGAPPPPVGERIVLLDHELNSCWASVEQVEADAIVIAALDLDTWSEPTRPSRVFTSLSPRPDRLDFASVAFFTAGFRETTDPDAPTRQRQPA